MLKVEQVSGTGGADLLYKNVQGEKQNKNRL